MIMFELSVQIYIWGGVFLNFFLENWRVWFGGSQGVIFEKINQDFWNDEPSGFYSFIILFWGGVFVWWGIDNPYKDFFFLQETRIKLITPSKRNPE